MINTSTIGKAVKIRFLEGYNGRNVRSFVVFLSPHDVWTAVVSQVGDQSAARVPTADHSCTVPPLPAEGEPFTSGWYDGTADITADGGPTSVTRTREGNIEVVADGDIAVGSLTDQRITQVQDDLPGGGRPPGCNDLTEGGFNGDLTVPTSGLTGSAAIISCRYDGPGAVGGFWITAQRRFRTPLRNRVVWRCRVGTHRSEFGTRAPQPSRRYDPHGRVDRLERPADQRIHVYNIVNANAAPGTLANYGGTFAHRTTTSCVSRAVAPGDNDPCS